MTQNEELTPKGKRELLRQQTMARFPFLIKVHIGEDEYRYANYAEDLTFNNEVYSASYFKIVPPAKNTDDKTGTSIQFSNMNNFWTEQVRNYSDDMTLEFVATIIYEEGTTSYIEPIEVYRFKLGDANWTESTCKFDLILDDRMNIQFPPDVADALNTAGVV